MRARVTIEDFTTFTGHLLGFSRCLTGFEAFNRESISSISEITKSWQEIF